MWLDTHCHLDAPEFLTDLGQIIENAHAAGVRGILLPAVQANDFEAVKGSHLAVIKKNFESKTALNRNLQFDREHKLKILRKFVDSFPHLLYPLFNQ